MTQYLYTALGPNGQKRQGMLEAISEADASRQLSAAGDRVLSLRERGTRAWFKLEHSQDIKAEAAADFALELAGLLSAGAPLSQALSILTEGRGTSARLAMELLRELDQGGSLSAGLNKAGDGAAVLAPFAEAGEAGAGLEAMLERGGQFLKARREALQKVRSALAYPVFILCLALIAITVITVFVAPALAPTFEGTGDGGLILFLAGIGAAISDNSSFVLIGAAVSVLGSFLLLRTPAVQSALSQLLIKMPLIGVLKRDLDAGQALSVLAALLRTGRSVESALTLSGVIAGTSTKKAFDRIALRLRDGVPLARAFSDETALPLEAKRLAALGEQSSALPKAMQQAGEICLARAMRRIDQTSAALGPFLVISLGVSVSLLMLNVLGSLSSIGGAAL